VKILLSPAKTLDYSSDLPTSRSTTPVFQEEAAQIARKLSRFTKEELSKLMSISDKLTELNYERYKEFQDYPEESVTRPALYAFAGDVYDGLDSYSLSTDLLNEAQGKIRILSGLYGMLRPLDKIQPYRLEMGTDLSLQRTTNLYDFWQTKITATLNKDTADDEVIVNCASQEYYKAVDEDKLNRKVISPVFKDYKNGKLKIISFYAKQARGAMARHLIEIKGESIDDILQFKWEGYSYDAPQTVDEHSPVFTR